MYIAMEGEIQIICRGFRATARKKREPARKGVIIDGRMTKATSSYCFVERGMTTRSYPLF